MWAVPPNAAVHRLQPELLPLNREAEHVLLVLGRVSARLPELEVVHVGRDHLLVAARPVLLLPVPRADERQRRAAAGTRPNLPSTHPARAEADDARAPASPRTAAAASSSAFSFAQTLPTFCV